MYLLGIDIGSSAIKASIVDATSGECITSGQSPITEMEIYVPQKGWAEQNPEEWMKHTQIAIRQILNQSKISSTQIKAIGITYQMHGLVCVDKEGDVLRPSIIWCDSRAVEVGKLAFNHLGEQFCLTHYLNSPGNFTASKLRWVKENEPDIYRKIYKIMLPGDYLAFKLTGKINTTVSGLSEGIFWDYQNKDLADDLLNYYQLEKSFLADILSTFGYQGEVTTDAANYFGLAAGTPVTYRAGDQPNNALSLSVLNPGEIAATAGTSGVVYGVTDRSEYEPLSRVNTFVHVNNTKEIARNGILLCINGTGILNSWLRKTIAPGLSYPEINTLASKIPVGSENLLVLPFGNGAERILGNANIGSSMHNLNLNTHSASHVLRAGQEGIAFAFHYGISIMKKMGLETKVIRAGYTNMFLSPVFRQTLADISEAVIELYNTDGAKGAALGAGIGAGIYKTPADAFKNLKCIERVSPIGSHTSILNDVYSKWEKELNKIIEH